jgi:hypothetical protein
LAEHKRKAVNLYWLEVPRALAPKNKLTTCYRVLLAVFLVMQKMNKSQGLSNLCIFLPTPHRFLKKSMIFAYNSCSHPLYKPHSLGFQSRTRSLHHLTLRTKWTLIMLIYITNLLYVVNCKNEKLEVQNLQNS